MENASNKTYNRYPDHTAPPPPPPPSSSLFFSFLRQLFSQHVKRLGEEGAQSRSTSAGGGGRRPNPSTDALPPALVMKTSEPAQ